MGFAHFEGGFGFDPLGLGFLPLRLGFQEVGEAFHAYFILVVTDSQVFFGLQESIFCHLNADLGILDVKTGGSDFQGERVKPEICLAALELEVDWLFE